MMIRRTFLKSSTAALVAAGAGPVMFFSGPSEGVAAGFSRARFDGLVNAWFTVDDGAHPTLELIRVDGGPEVPGYEQFTAVFRGHRDDPLKESLVTLTPEGEAPMQLHLAPSGSDADGTYFVAMFNVEKPAPPMPSCAPATA